MECVIFDDTPSPPCGMDLTSEPECLSDDQEIKFVTEQEEEKDVNKLLLTACVEEALSDVLIVSVQYGDKMFRGALMDTSKLDMPYGVARASPSRFETEPRERQGTAVLNTNGKFQQPIHENSLTALSFRHSYHQTLPCSLVRPIKQKVTRSSLRSLQISSSGGQKSICPYCKSAFEHVPRQDLNLKENSCQTEISFAHIQQSLSQLVKLDSTPPVKKKTPSQPPRVGNKRSQSPVTTKSPMIKISYATPHGKDKVLCIKPKPQHVKIAKKKIHEESQENERNQFSDLVGETGHDVRVNHNGPVNNMNTLNQPIVMVKYSEFVESQSDDGSSRSDVNTITTENSTTQIYHLNAPKTSSTDQQQHPILIQKPLIPIPPEAVKPQFIKKQYTEYMLGGVGRTFKVGDVVWGKIHGFPWWPCWIREILITYEGEVTGAIIRQEAYVIWLASPTTSHLPLTEIYSFSEYFKARFDKRKRGTYRIAIKQAHEMLNKIATDPDMMKTLFSSYPSSMMVQ